MPPSLGAKKSSSAVTIAMRLSKNLTDVISVALFLWLGYSVFTSLIPHYFSPEYLVEFRSFATIHSAMAFNSGENPFAESDPGGTSNLYSVTWPIVISTIATLFDAKSAEQFRQLAAGANLLILLLTLAFIAYQAAKRELGLALASAVITLVLFGNLIRFSLGEWPHAAGLNLSCIAILLCTGPAINFSRLGLSAFFIIAAASFKIYFILCAAPFAIGCCFYASKSRYQFAQVVFLLLCVIGAIVLLTYSYPTYFAHAIGVHSLFVNSEASIDREFRLILDKFYWYYVGLFLCATNLMYRRWPRKEILQFLSVLAVTAYVTLVMGRHTGSSILYSIHIITPLLLFSLFLIRGELDRALCGLLMLAMITISWSSHSHWHFGILEADSLQLNRETLTRLRGTIDELKDHKIYVTPPVSFLTPQNSRELMDTGNREFLADWQKERYKFDEHWLYRHLGWSQLEIRDLHWRDLQQRSEFLLCSHRCPKNNENFELIDKLGVIRLASGQVTQISLYRNLAYPRNL